MTNEIFANIRNIIKQATNVGCRTFGDNFVFDQEGVISLGKDAGYITLRTGTDSIYNTIISSLVSAIEEREREIKDNINVNYHPNCETFILNMIETIGTYTTYTVGEKCDFEIEGVDKYIEIYTWEKAIQLSLNIEYLEKNVRGALYKFISKRLVDRKNGFRSEIMSLISELKTKVDQLNIEENKIQKKLNLLNTRYYETKDKLEDFLF